MQQQPPISQQLSDLYGIWHVPFWQRTWFTVTMWMLAIIFVVALGYLALRIWKKRQKPAPTPWEHALGQLEELAARNCSTPEQAQAFYLELTALLKTYLNERYGYNVQGKTDAELVDYVRAQEELPAGVVDHIGAILQGAVLIKFAGEQARAQQIEGDTTRARSIITITIPKEDS